jgi:hypothetical protein
MRGTKAKKLRRQIYGPRSEWQEGAMHPRERRYIVSKEVVTLIPSMTSIKEPNSIPMGKGADGKPLYMKYVDWAYFGPIFDPERRALRRLKREV